MRTTRIRTVLLLACVVFLCAAVALQLRLAAGAGIASPPVLTLLVTGLMALGTVTVAWPVRRWNRGRRDRVVDPLRAARIVALAKAAALAGAVLTGGWAAFLAVVLLMPIAVAQTERAVLGGLVVLASAVLCVCGLVAERWCVVPPDDEGGATADRAPSPA